jgi:hypothetical protein
MKERINTLKNGYYKPTPVKWRKIGDAIQESAIVAAAVVALFAAPPAWVPVVIFAAGRIGKIITNFATK